MEERSKGESLSGLDDGSKSSRRCGQGGHRLPPTSIQFQGETLAIG
ncbi:MAG: hypothetical protein HQL78_14115 [Magnetococcales bacterium]|nr:hypothetical protein [Magnetococcales bacterium]